MLRHGARANDLGSNPFIRIATQVNANAVTSNEPSFIRLCGRINPLLSFNFFATAFAPLHNLLSSDSSRSFDDENGRPPINRPAINQTLFNELLQSLSRVQAHNLPTHDS